jgi:phosphoglycerate dehydrogenase-like enzyme
LCCFQIKLRCQLDQICEIVPEWPFNEDRQEIESKASEIEIASGWVPRDLIRRLPNLRWLQQWGAGADWLMDHPDLAEQDYVLTNTSGLHAVPISEHIFAMMLALARSLPAAVKAQSQRTWLQLESHEVFELAGKTILLVGVGAIGTRTATIANAMGARPGYIIRCPALGWAHAASSCFKHCRWQTLWDRPSLLRPRDDGGAELRAMKSSALSLTLGVGKRWEPI